MKLNYDPIFVSKFCCYLVFLLNNVNYFSWQLKMRMFPFKALAKIDVAESIKQLRWQEATRLCPLNSCSDLLEGREILFDALQMKSGAGVDYLNKRCQYIINDLKKFPKVKE